MAASNVVISAEDHERFQTELEALSRNANAKLVYVIDKAGQQIAAYGEMDGVDPTSLASLTAGEVAATEGVAALVGEKQFTTLFHEGKQASLHISVVAERMILLIVFDERSSLGLVRLRVEQHQPALHQIVTTILSRPAGTAGGDCGADAFAEITEADIDALFG